MASHAAGRLRSDEGRDDDTVELPVRDLVVDWGLRADGIDEAHTRQLTEILDSLPPIVVERIGMRVIDGSHRVAAAARSGRRTIRARLIDGSDLELLEFSLRANTSHGLPLSLADRKEAALRVLALRPDYSDRRVGALVGISARTVARLRTSSSAPLPQSNVTGGAASSARTGRDGRVRPLSAEAGKARARALFESRPEITLREVAQEAGISLGTAHSVRSALLRQARATQDGIPPGPAAIGSLSSDPHQELVRLLRDPALSRSQAGREALARLRGLVVDRQDADRFVEGIPPHQLETTVRLVRQAIRMWFLVAERLEESLGTGQQDLLAAGEPWPWSTPGSKGDCPGR
jgi:hypothetical protein